MSIFARSVEILVFVGASGLTTLPAFAADTCRFGGVTEPDPQTDIVDVENHVIARLTGSAIAMTIEALPEMPNVKARIVTSIPEVPSFRIEGWASVRALGIRTTTRVDVVPPLVALNRGVRLDAAVRRGDELYIEKRLKRDFEQTLVTKVACSALGFREEAPLAPEPLPVNARAYRFNGETLPLFDAATGNELSLVTLTRQRDAAPVLLYAVAEERDWLRLRYDGEISVSAWVHKRDLQPLAPGEVFDRLAPARALRSVPKLKLAGTPTLHRATKAVKVRVQASTQAPPIGEIQADAEFYVVEVVAGWASVVPRALGVMPVPDRQFWVEANAIGL